MDHYCTVRDSYSVECSQGRLEIGHELSLNIALKAGTLSHKE
ncbi:hypothetical protein HMPREF9346_04909 [Escherichia coli MS 119-7]|nr:hypothetical protein HMPREF9346_04909 [Escherichia coli MS 119-7]